MSVVRAFPDGNETVVQAAIREAREEVGVTVAPADTAVVGVMHRKAGDERVDFFVAVSVWDGDLANCEPDKCDELRWCARDALPANTIPYIRRAVQNHAKGVWFEEFGF